MATWAPRVNIFNVAYINTGNAQMQNNMAVNMVHVK